MSKQDIIEILNLLDFKRRYKNKGDKGMDIEKTEKQAKKNLNDFKIIKNGIKRAADIAGITFEQAIVFMGAFNNV